MLRYLWSAANVTKNHRYGILIHLLLFLQVDRPYSLTLLTSGK